MKLKDRCLGFLRSVVVTLLIVSVSVLNVQVACSFAAESAATPELQDPPPPAEKGTAGKKDSSTPVSAENAKDVEAEYQAAAITQKGTGPVPETTTSSSSNTMLYAGVGLAAIAAVAVAAGGGGGSSSSEPEPEPEPIKPPVGANLNGDNWHGRLILKDSGFKEEVTATVKQNGSALDITTSSTQKYGKRFIGKIDKSAFIRVTDQDTRQDWTTHYQKARWNMIDLYDYVHNFKDLDRLYLTREALQ